MVTAGYSQTPLAKKLGIKPGYRIMVVNKPAHYETLFSDFPENVTEVKDSKANSLDFIHLFVEELDHLEVEFPKLKPLLKQTGMFWISWPKRSSSILTNLNRDIIRRFILKNGLVDTKVCAVDDNWSGLKFMHRIKDRTP